MSIGDLVHPRLIRKRICSICGTVGHTKRNCQTAHRDANRKISPRLARALAIARRYRALRNNH